MNPKLLLLIWFSISFGSKFIFIFKGEDNDFSKAVCLNAAAGLVVNETHQNFDKAYDNARKHILSGQTFKQLEKIQNGWKCSWKNNKY